MSDNENPQSENTFLDRETPYLESLRALIKRLGDDPNREGLEKTPTRILKSLDFLTRGYHQTVSEVVNGAIFTIPEANSSSMVICKSIEVYSLCEHHMLPFFGKCHVGYLPKGRVLGLSKIPRLMEVFARRLQVQERLTAQVADSLVEALNPIGVGVVMECYHLCMMMRGVEKQNSLAKTSALRGEFLKGETRSEFFNLIR